MTTGVIYFWARSSASCCHRLQAWLCMQSVSLTRKWFLSNLRIKWIWRREWASHPLDRMLRHIVEWAISPFSLLRRSLPTLTFGGGADQMARPRPSTNLLCSARPARASSRRLRHFSQSTLIVAETTEALSSVNFLVNSKASIFDGPSNGIRPSPR